MPKHKTTFRSSTCFVASSPGCRYSLCAEKRKSSNKRSIPFASLSHTFVHHISYNNHRSVNSCICPPKHMPLAGKRVRGYLSAILSIIYLDSFVSGFDKLSHRRQAQPPLVTEPEPVEGTFVWWLSNTSAQSLSSLTKHICIHAWLFATDYTNYAMSINN
jgi:hypothetical protein